MKRINKISLWVFGAVLALAAFSGTSKAATTDNIDIHVSIAGAKSLTIVGATFYDYGALNVNISSVSLSSITIQNDSTVFIQTYTITGANAQSTTGGTDWTLAASTGANQYALAAQFSTNAPNDTDGDWSGDDLTLSAQTCSVTAFGNGTEAQAGSNVATGANRGLWFRIKTPSSVADASQHDITLTVSVL